eukprot:GHVN01031020.1.p1 GENE.GHVN01031020.1~~GHVN01031020.1.p1  ORF type:complete len:454 (+),score=51.31 GHVN01031020.1:51-1412(+)
MQPWLGSLVIKAGSQSLRRATPRIGQRQDVRPFFVLNSGDNVRPMPKQYAYTKYRITKPVEQTGVATEFDDIMLTQPSRSDLAAMTKESESFLRFLKFVTDEEGRQTAFVEFTKRCREGLVVEKDVFISKTELLETMWQNGCTIQELNAYDLSFPADHKFHYPELAVLFDLEEEHCYKYCLKKRAGSADELVEVTKKPGMGFGKSAGAFGATTVGLWYGLQNNVLGNAWFLTKTWPFFGVFWMILRSQQRAIQHHFHALKNADAKIAEEFRMDGEDTIASQLRKYANDSKCLEELVAFRMAVKKQMADYRSAWIAAEQNELASRTFNHLHTIQQAERAIGDSLQEVIVTQVIQKFTEDFESSQSLQDKAFEFALTQISGKSSEKDPIADMLKESFAKIVDSSSTATANINGSIEERVAAISQNKEKEFLNAFSVRFVGRSSSWSPSHFKHQRD